jgi:hypothetical protein
MYNFDAHVTSILESFNKHFLIEMPVGVPSKEDWIDSVMARIIYNRADTPASIKARFASKSEKHTSEPLEGSRYVFDQLCDTLIVRLEDACAKLGITHNKDVIAKIPEILAQLRFTSDEEIKDALTDCITQNVQDDIQNGETDIRFTPVYFIEAPVRLVVSGVFDKIFDANEEEQAFYDDWEEDVVEPPKHISYPFPDNIEGFKTDIFKALTTVLPQVSRRFNITLPSNKNNTGYTARIIAQSDELLAMSFPRSYRGRLKGTKDSGASLSVRKNNPEYMMGRKAQLETTTLLNFTQTNFTFTGDVSNLTPDEQAKINELQTVTPVAVGQYSGYSFNRLNKTKHMFPDTMTLIWFIKSMVNKGAMTQIQAEPNSWSKGGNKKKESEDDTFDSSLF